MSSTPMSNGKSVEMINSAEGSPMGSSIFIVQSDGKKNSRTHADPFRHEPITQKNLGQTILRGIRSLWATRQTEKDLKKNQELYVKTTIRELFIYLLFIAILCIITFGMTSTKTYYFTTALRSSLTEQKASGPGDQPSYDDISNFDDFWVVMEEPILNSLYTQKWYNNRSLDDEQLGYVLFENKILGSPRLRQLRVTNHSCTVHKKFEEQIELCYAPYSSSSDKEDREKYSSSPNDNLTINAWHYQTASELGSSSTSGLVSRYGGGGYVLDLHVERDYAEKQLKILKDNLWLNRGTRAVFLDFTVYNGNINLFCQIKLIIEFPASGGAVTSKRFQSVKLIRYVTSMDYFVLACEILFVLFTIYYTVEEVIEIKQYKIHYFKSIWNVLDVLIILISYVCIAFNVYRQVKVGQILDDLLKDQQGFADFEFLSYWQTQFNNIIAFTVFLAWIKIFKYVSFNKTMTQLSTTLSRCAKDVFGFSVMFMIVFLAYAQLGYLLFGSMVDDYKTFTISIFTLFRIILGDFDFNAILDVHRILGPIFFLTYVFFVFFVLLNMFLAIINDTYSEVKNDLTNQKSEFELGHYFKKSYEKVLDRLNVKRDRVIDIQDALKSADMNKDGIIEFEEWRRALKARGYTDAEIEHVFARYDTDGDRVLRGTEQIRFQSDLIAQENDLNMNIKDLKNDPNAIRAMNIDANYISYDEFTVVARRIDRMEYSVGNVVARIDDVLLKLESLEKAKVKRREALTKILTTITDNNHLSTDEKQTRLVKMIHEQLDEKNFTEKIPDGSVYYSSTSLRDEQNEREHSRPSSGTKINRK